MNEIKENNYDVNVLWKGNIVCIWILENDFILTMAGDSDLFDHETSCVGKLISLFFYVYEEHTNRRSYSSCASI
jgi:hypothetical protein